MRGQEVLHRLQFAVAVRRAVIVDISQNDAVEKCFQHARDGTAPAGWFQHACGEFLQCQQRKHRFRRRLVKVRAALFLGGAGRADRRTKIGLRRFKPGGKTRLNGPFNNARFAMFRRSELAGFVNFLAGKSGIFHR
ncbi:hypothetical protein D3C87_1769940 [compost metagenome]